jgi:hypothetical protein
VARASEVELGQIEGGGKTTLYMQPLGAVSKNHRDQSVR